MRTKCNNCQADPDEGHAKGCPTVGREPVEARGAPASVEAHVQGTPITDAQRDAFIAALNAVCAAHGLSLGHEDGHGQFRVGELDDYDFSGAYVPGCYADWPNRVDPDAVPGPFDPDDSAGNP
jgi:hypothetical protein